MVDSVCVEEWVVVVFIGDEVVRGVSSYSVVSVLCVVKCGFKLILAELLFFSYPRRVTRPGCSRPDTFVLVLTRKCLP